MPTPLRGEAAHEPVLRRAEARRDARCDERAARIARRHAHRCGGRSLDVGLGHRQRAAGGARALGRSGRPARRRRRADQRHRRVRGMERHRARAPRSPRIRRIGTCSKRAEDRRAVSGAFASVAYEARARRWRRRRDVATRSATSTTRAGSSAGATACSGRSATRTSCKPRASRVGRGQRHSRQRRAVRLPRAVRGRSRRGARRGRALACRRSRRVHVRRGCRVVAGARLAAWRARRRGLAAVRSRSRCGAARCGSGRSWRPPRARGARWPSRSSARAGSRCAWAAAPRCIAAAMRALHEAAARRVAGYERLSAAAQVAAVARSRGRRRPPSSAPRMDRRARVSGRSSCAAGSRCSNRRVVNSSSRSQWSKHGKRI